MLCKSSKHFESSVTNALNIQNIYTCFKTHRNIYICIYKENNTWIPIEYKMPHM